MTAGSASIAPASVIMTSPVANVATYPGQYTTTMGGDLFSQMDTNGDGVISRAEMSQWRIG